MAVPDLVYEIARRFSHAEHANPSHPDHFYDQDWELYMDAARECVRLMEWARRECIVDDSPVSTGGPGGAMVRPSEYWASAWAQHEKLKAEGSTHPAALSPPAVKWPRPMTLPPDDWKP